MTYRLPSKTASAGSGKWLFCAAVSLCLLALACWPQALQHLRYERESLATGQIWRLATAHLVHLNAAHLFLNIAGLFLVCELLWLDMPLRQGVALLAVSAIGVGLMLWWLHPELAWYAGLSGALHGMWAGCALAGWRPGSRPLASRISAAGLPLLVVKLASEHYFGPSPAAAQAIGAPVVAAAHCYGALAGILYMALANGTAGLLLRRKAVHGAD